MGTWGTSLYDNDSTSDIRGDFLDKLKRGKTNEEATKELVDENMNTGDMEEEPLFCFGLPWQIHSGTTEDCYRK